MTDRERISDEALQEIFRQINEKMEADGPYFGMTFALFDEILAALEAAGYDIVPTEGMTRSPRCPNHWACQKRCACHRLSDEAMAEDLAAHYVVESFHRLVPDGGDS